MMLPELSYQTVRGDGVRIVAKLNSLEVGHCYLYVLHNDLHARAFGFVEDIFVETHARRMGVARALALGAIELGWQLGCYKILATSRFKHEDQHRRALTYGYKKWGYEFRIDAPPQKGSEAPGELRAEVDALATGAVGEKTVPRAPLPKTSATAGGGPAFEEYVSSLSRKILAAGVVIADEDDRVLLVQPSYKADWEIPGGTVEENETPWNTAVRECREELGLTLTPWTPAGRRFRSGIRLAS